MGKSLQEVAQKLKTAKERVQLIYAFNGVGKTRLSQEFVNLAMPLEDIDDVGIKYRKVLYYNAFTEDLFYWDKELSQDGKPKLKIQPNSFTDWILRERGDTDIVKKFQKYTTEKITPLFQEKNITIEGKRRKTYPGVTFSYAAGDEQTDFIKVSKGEESNFIWSIFFTLIQEVVDVRKEPRVSERSSNDFDELEYIFIDDPVTSLDEGHLIELAVDLSELIKTSSSDLKFVITTHSPLFYNVMWNDLNRKASKKHSKTGGSEYDPRTDFKKYRLDKMVNGLYNLKKQNNDSPFSYHLFLLKELQLAIESNQIRKYHFNFLRNILEKTATFLGYSHWQGLLLEEHFAQSKSHLGRVINLSSHSAHAGYEVADINDEDKDKLKELVEYITSTYRFNSSD